MARSLDEFRYVFATFLERADQTVSEDYLLGNIGWSEHLASYSWFGDWGHGVAARRENARKLAATFAGEVSPDTVLKAIVNQWGRIQEPFEAKEWWTDLLRSLNLLREHPNDLLSSGVVGARIW